MLGEKDKHGKTQTNNVVPKRKKKEAPWDAMYNSNPQPRKKNKKGGLGEEVNSALEMV